MGGPIVVKDSKIVITNMPVTEGDADSNSAAGIPDRAGISSTPDTLENASQRVNVFSQDAVPPLEVPPTPMKGQFQITPDLFDFNESGHLVIKDPGIKEHCATSFRTPL